MGFFFCSFCDFCSALADVHVFPITCKEDYKSKKINAFIKNNLTLYASGADDELKKGKLCFEVFCCHEFWHFASQLVSIDLSHNCSRDPEKTTRTPVQGKKFGANRESPVFSYGETRDGVIVDFVFQPVVVLSFLFYG